MIGESRQKNGSSFYLLIYSVKPEKLRRKCGLRRQKDIIQRRQQEDSDNDLYLLLQAQLAVLEGHKKDAQENLDQYSYSRFSLSKKFEMDAYYLYLTAVCRAEEAYTEENSKKTFEECIMKNRESWQILCNFSGIR